ncbi:Nn.00g037040.m01.CDS01 [Neocucurbitaria sp. VM-36]
MSSSSSYGSYAQDKGAYASRPSTSSTSYSTASSSSLYANSSRSHRYNSKPPVIHNGGGQTNDPNTSTSAPNSGYYN